MSLKDLKRARLTVDETLALVPGEDVRGDFESAFAAYKTYKEALSKSKRHAAAISERAAQHPKIKKLLKKRPDLRLVDFGDELRLCALHMLLPSLVEMFGERHLSEESCYLESFWEELLDGQMCIYRPVDGDGDDDFCRCHECGYMQHEYEE